MQSDSGSCHRTTRRRSFAHTGHVLENFRLRVFREVARHRSFRRAAEVLYISQPAVTQQVKALEEELGQRLLDRSGGRVSLTSAGTTLLQFAEQSQAVLREGEDALAGMQGRLHGTLLIAASTTVAQYILPRLLASFARQYPEVALQMESANTERVVQRMVDAEAALGLIEGPAHRPDLVSEAWISDELVLAVPATHAWAGLEIAPAALLRAPLLMREQGSGTRAVLEAALRGAGVPPEQLRVSMELGSTEALLACVEAGLGVGFASRFALRRQRALRTLAIARLRGLRVRRELRLLRQRGPSPGGAVDAFYDHLRAYARRRSERAHAGPEPVS